MAPSPAKGTRASPRRRVARLVAGLACALILAVWGVQEVWGESHWLTVYVTYAPPVIYLAIPGLALLVALLCFETRAVFWALVAAVLCLLGVARPTVHPSRPVAPASRTLRVVTWNVHNQEHSIPAIRGALASLGPDIVCLQEANANRFRDCWPEAHAVKAESLLILTCGEVHHRRSIRVEREGHYLRSLLEADITVRGTRLEVLDVHLYSYQLAAALRRPSEQQARELSAGAVQMRTLQIEKVTDWLETRAGPALVMGDFNTPPRGRLYDRLQEVATDAFAASGTGFGWTFPGSHPVLRIDYVWLTRELKAVRCRRVPGGPSDHCPVVADIVVP